MPDGAQNGWYPLSSQPRTPSTATPPPRPGSPPPSSEIRVGENGYIHGVDGMLDQIASALTRHAGPMLRREVLPVLQRDETLQTRVGEAAGAAMAQKLLPWIIVGVGALGVLATIEVLRYRKAGGRLGR